MIPRRSGLILSPYLTLLLLAGCGSPPMEEWCVAEPGAERVLNGPGAGAWADAGGGNPKGLREVWRAGGESGPHLLQPTDLDVSAGGAAAIADFALTELAVVRPDGDFERWLSAGPGPGEVRSSVAVAWWGPERLRVLDLVGSRVVLLRDGRVDDALPIDPGATAGLLAGGRLEQVDLQPGGGVVGVTPPAPLEGAGEGVRTMSLLRIPPGSARTDTLRVDTVRTVGGDRFPGWRLPGEPRIGVAVGPDGRLAVAGMDGRYRIVVLGAEGAPRLVVCRDADPFAVASRERGMVADPDAPPGLVALIRNAPPASDPAATGHLFYGAGGRLWVQRNRRAPLDASPVPGVAGAVHDVFDPGGRFLGTVTAPGSTRLVGAVGDTVFGFEQDEAGGLWLVMLERPD